MPFAEEGIAWREFSGQTGLGLKLLLTSPDLRHLVFPIFLSLLLLLPTTFALGTISPPKRAPKAPSRGHLSQRNSSRRVHVSSCHILRGGYRLLSLDHEHKGTSDSRRLAVVMSDDEVSTRARERIMARRKRLRYIHALHKLHKRDT